MLSACERAHVDAQILAVERELAHEDLAEPALMGDDVGMIHLSKQEQRTGRRGELRAHIARAETFLDAVRERPLYDGGEHDLRAEHSSREQEREDAFRFHGWPSPRDRRG